MSHARRVNAVVASMRKVSDQAQANALAAEDVLTALEDREARRSTREASGASAGNFSALRNRLAGQ